jgi:hypothetical protein
MALIITASFQKVKCGIIAVDYTLTPHIHDGVVCRLVGQHRVLVSLKRASLRFTMQGQRLDHLADDAGQVTLEVCGVPTLDGRVGDERQVRAHKDA